jgi:tetratricopeptide (TPR) repeat protein
LDCVTLVVNIYAAVSYYSINLIRRIHMRKYLLHVLIISFVFLLAPTAQVVSYAGEIETWKEEVRMNPDDAYAHYNLGAAYYELGRHEEAIEALP